MFCMFSVSDMSSLSSSGYFTSTDAASKQEAATQAVPEEALLLSTIDSTSLAESSFDKLHEFAAASSLLPLPFLPPPQPPLCPLSPPRLQFPCCRPAKIACTDGKRDWEAFGFAENPALETSRAFELLSASKLNPSLSRPVSGRCLRRRQILCITPSFSSGPKDPTKCLAFGPTMRRQTSVGEATAKFAFGTVARRSE
jgi:hypothetical protein